MQANTATATQAQTASGSALSGILLVAGTSIGAGMLALPMITGFAGFLPAMFVNTLCWLFMLATGLLLLEATLWMPAGANLLSMAEKFLGTTGKVITGGAFLFLYYCLLVSYIAGGTPLLTNSVGPLDGFSPYLLFSAGFGFIVYLGHRVVDKTNWLLMMSLILSYFLLITVGSSEVNPEKLFRRNWGLTFAAAPVLFSAYGYHNIIPTLTSYLKGNINNLRLAIVGGTALPFLVYSLWQWMIIGSLSPEEISAAASSGVPITQTLQTITGNSYVYLLGGYFGFFALVTSFLGVALSMVDFLRDGLKLTDNPLNRMMLCTLVFLPPTIFAACNPGIFVEALGVAGGFGEALLNGLLPIVMVWMGRYHLRLSSQEMVPGGRLLLLALGVFTLFIMGLEAQHLFF